MVLQKNKSQWPRRESPEIDPHKYSQLIFENREKAILKRRDYTFFSIVFDEGGVHNWW